MGLSLVGPPGESAALASTLRVALRVPKKRTQLNPPGLLTPENHEILNVCYFNQLSVG